MYYYVELLTSVSLSWTDPLCPSLREEYWVYTNKRAARLKYREVCLSHIHCGKYHEYGTCHGWPIMRVHKHDRYTSEITVMLQKITYRPKKLHDIKVYEGYTK